METSIPIAAEWDGLISGENTVYYHKKLVYEMQWKDIDLSNYIVACAKFGGPIAIIRNVQVIQFLRSASTKPDVSIFTSAGLLLTSFVWNNPGGQVLSMEWTVDETLHFLVDDGTIYRYNVHGESLPSLTMGEKCFQGIKSSFIWNNGIVVITNSFQILAITDFRDSTVVEFSSSDLNTIPHCFLCIDSKFTASRQLEIIISVNSNILIIESNGVKKTKQLNYQILLMSISPNGTFIACYTDDFKVKVFTSDFTRELPEIQIQSTETPNQLVWCGTDSILLFFSEEQNILMLAPNGESLDYSYDESAVFLIPEIDSCRILSSRSMELLHRLPNPTVKIFQIGSTDPSSYLYEAYELFSKSIPKTDETIRELKSNLASAVETCIQAACYEFDTDLQTNLLKASVFGRAFCDSFPRNRIKNACLTLRVLNALRDKKSLGIPLTYSQYQHLTPATVILKLIKLNKHLLAFKISQSLDLPIEPVLIHWAAAKVSSSPNLSDEEILNVIVEKLQICPSISFSTIASSAFKNNRTRLASMILDYESNPSQQIPLLTSMGDVRKSLVKAIESGDTDLIFFVIFHLINKGDREELKEHFQEFQDAKNLFILYAQENNAELLEKFFNDIGYHQGIAELNLKRSYENTEAEGLGTRGSALGTVRTKYIEQAQNHYMMIANKEYMFHAKMCEEQIKLLKAQHELEISMSQQSFMNLSVSDTIKKLLTLGNHRAAQKIKTDFKVPDKRFYWLKLSTLAQAKDWAGLEKFAKERKPPIGYRPFVDVCVEENNNAMAAKFIAKIQNLQERAESYARIGMVAEAAETAAQAKDGELFARLKSTFAAQNINASALFDALKDRFSI